MPPSSLDRYDNHSHHPQALKILGDVVKVIFSFSNPKPLATPRFFIACF
jgi:hypothetical protein